MEEEASTDDSQNVVALNAFILRQHGYELRKDARILDFGCGSGRHTYEYLDAGYRNTTGFDIRDYAELRQDSDRRHFHFLAPGAAFAMPFPDNHFDFVTSTTVFEHVLNQSETRAAFRCNVDHLFTSIRKAGKPTLSIGDGGNEIGFGEVHDVLTKAMPDLNKADITPCGGGIVSAIPTHVLVVATSSNLGAYGVCAALAIRREDPTLCHTPEEEIALEHVGVGLGLTDGGTGKRIAAVNGIPVADNAAVVTLMRALVARALAQEEDRGF